MHTLRNQGACRKAPLNSAIYAAVLLLYTVLLFISAQAIRASFLASPTVGSASCLRWCSCITHFFYTCTLVLYAIEDGPGTVDQRCAQIGIATLADPQQLGFSSCWYLFWHKVRIRTHGSLADRLGIVVVIFYWSSRTV